MDPSTIAIAALTLLEPLLKKAGEKGAETIAEKIAEKAIEKSTWKNIKRLFVIDDEVEVIQSIENKPIATDYDIATIEDKIIQSMTANPQVATDIESSFEISPTNKIIAEQLLKSIQRDTEQLKELFEDRRLASIETEGSYEIMISRTRRRIEKDQKEFFSLIGTI